MKTEKNQSEIQTKHIYGYLKYKQQDQVIIKPLQFGKNVIGTGIHCQIRIEKGFISTRHAVINVCESKLTLEDTGSKNGVKIYVKNKFVKIEKFKEIQIYPETVFLIANLKCQLDIPSKKYARIQNTNVYSSRDNNTSRQSLKMNKSLNKSIEKSNMKVQAKQHLDENIVKTNNPTKASKGKNKILQMINETNGKISDQIQVDKKKRSVSKKQQRKQIEKQQQKCQDLKKEKTVIATKRKQSKIKRQHMTKTKDLSKQSKQANRQRKSISQTSPNEKSVKKRKQYQEQKNMKIEHIQGSVSRHKKLEKVIKIRSKRNKKHNDSLQSNESYNVKVLSRSRKKELKQQKKQIKQQPKSNNELSLRQVVSKRRNPISQLIRQQDLQKNLLDPIETQTEQKTVVKRSLESNEKGEVRIAQKMMKYKHKTVSSQYRKISIYDVQLKQSMLSKNEVQFDELNNSIEKDTNRHIVKDYQCRVILNQTVENKLKQDNRLKQSQIVNREANDQEKHQIVNNIIEKIEKKEISQSGEVQSLNHPNIKITYNSKINVNAQQDQLDTAQTMQLQKPDKMKRRKPMQKIEAQHQIRQVKQSDNVKRVLLSGIKFEPITSNIKVVASVKEQFDYLIMKSYKRTFKSLYAISKGIPIVSYQWLKQSQLSNQLLSIQNYQFFDNPTVYNSIQYVRGGHMQIYSGYTFYLGSDNYHMERQNIRILIQSNGGQIIEAIEDQEISGKCIGIIRNKWENNDEQLHKDIERLGSLKFKVVFHLEMIFDSCETQHINFKKHRVRIDKK